MQLCWVRIQIWKLIEVVRPLQQQVLALASLSTSKTRIQLRLNVKVLKRVCRRLTLPVGTLVMALTGTLVMRSMMVLELPMAQPVAMQLGTVSLTPWSMMERGRRPSPNTKQLTTLQLVNYIINNKLESMTRLWREAKPSLVWTSISFSWTRIRTIQQLKKL